MACIHVRTVVSVDGELHLANLPCRKGDEVEAVVSVRKACEIAHFSGETATR